MPIRCLHFISYFIVWKFNGKITVKLKYCEKRILSSIAMVYHEIYKEYSKNHFFFLGKKAR